MIENNLNISIFNKMKLVANDLQKITLEKEPYIKKMATPFIGIEPHGLTNMEWENFFSLYEKEKICLKSWEELENNLMSF